MGREFFGLYSMFYRSILFAYVFLLFIIFFSFASYVLVKDELFSLEAVICSGTLFFEFFFGFCISNAIVYSICYIFEKYLPFK